MRVGFEGESSWGTGIIKIHVSIYNISKMKKVKKGGKKYELE